MTDLICIDPAQIDVFWPHVKHLIRSAIERTGLSRFEDIERSILAGNQLVWIAWNGGNIEAAASTQLVNGACEIVACSGEHRERWLSLISKIEDYAKAEGCRCMRIIGREGWERALDGYRREYVILEKAL